MIRTYQLVFIVLAFIHLFGLSGCQATYPCDGKYECSDKGECPPGLFCNQANRRCYCTLDPDETTESQESVTSETEKSSGKDTVQGKPVGKAGSSGAGEDSQGGDSDRNGSSTNVLDNGTKDASSDVRVRGSKETESKNDFGKSSGGESDGGVGKNSGDESDGDNSNSALPLECKNETCVDSVTGLEWMRCSVGQSGSECASGSASLFRWQQAVNDCDELVLAGYTDWRLPSIHELISIVDYSTSDPSINSTIFPETPVQASWSSSPYTVNPSGQAWYVNFSSGLITYDLKNTIFFRNYIEPAPMYHARCVRGEPIRVGIFTYEIKAEELVVHDQVTSLTWQGCPVGQSGIGCSGTVQTFSWRQAKDYCDGLDFASYSEWRLPDIHELISIVDYTESLPAIDKDKFPSTESNDPALFWSSSPIANQANRAWFVNFSDGNTKFQFELGGLVLDTSSADVNATYNVRCVTNEM